MELEKEKEKEEEEIEPGRFTRAVLHYIKSD